MALKFKCQNCGKDIVVRFLKVGEIAKCRSCGSANAVPNEEYDDFRRMLSSKWPALTSQKIVCIIFNKTGF